MRTHINNKIYKTLTLVHALEQRAIIIALAIALALVCMYAYFVVSAIVSTVVYKEARIASTALHSDIATLESKYIADKESITDTLAIQSGLETVASKTFVKRAVRVGRAQ